MTKRLIALTMAGGLAGLGAFGADACTSMIFKAEDGTRIYARTMEWGASDLKSEMKGQARRHYLGNITYVSIS
ncbi:MAG TPA: hypothetical protein VGG86_17325 [Roseiarcus sp.]|jgi:penicillin V acylase-like amidase (Ntn superfamily)